MINVVSIPERTTSDEGMSVVGRGRRNVCGTGSEVELMSVSEMIKHVEAGWLEYHGLSLRYLFFFFSLTGASSPSSALTSCGSCSESLIFLTIVCQVAGQLSAGISASVSSYRPLIADKPTVLIADKPSNPSPYH